LALGFSFSQINNGALKLHTGTALAWLPSKGMYAVNTLIRYSCWYCLPSKCQGQVASGTGPNASVLWQSISYGVSALDVVCHMNVKHSGLSIEFTSARG
jgi:hypothetical protein